MHRSVVRRFSIALAAGALACSAPADAPAEPAASPGPPAAVETPLVEVKAVPVRPPRTGERPPPRSVTAAEKATLKAFRASLQVGRTKTKAKDFPAAIAAFDEALRQRPNDAGVLAERGYARLLAGDLEAARGDLEAARERTSDPRRLGMIWFNVGLVAEASANPEAARRAFTLSNQLHPTRAAAARLGGAPVCTAEVDPKVVPATDLASWRAVHAHLVKEYGADDLPRPKTEAEARAAMCHDADKGDLWDVCFYTSEEVNAHASVLVGRAPDGKLLHFGELGFAETGACQPNGVLEVTPVGDLLHARYVEVALDWDLVSTAPDNPEAAPCEVDGDEVPDTCEFNCVAFSATVDDFVIDLRGKQRLLHVRRTTNQVRSEDPKRLVSGLATDVSVAATGVVLKDGGCDTTIPFTQPAASTG